ncbi:MAG: mycofactocin precursor [Actinobacteria bacterium]|nr:mycofactocin precursor [Actinomycetota bacterium]
MPDSAADLLERPTPEAADTELDAADIDAAEIADVQPDQVVAADLLVEEISIDGMCGVY